MAAATAKSTMPRFFYFDLGNVLLNFSHRRACRQVAEAAGLSPDVVWNTLFESGLEADYETGTVTSREMYDRFCHQTGARLGFDDLAHAASDIFEVNAGTMAILAQLMAVECRLGLLSNTNEAHWDFVSRGRFALIPAAFEVLALSFQIKAMKPDPRIFQAAADLAGVPPEEIFYVDDMPEHVAAARGVGIDAVQYTTPAALAADLRGRGVEFNY